MCTGFFSTPQFLSASFSYIYIEKINPEELEGVIRTEMG